MDIIVGQGAIVYLVSNVLSAIGYWAMALFILRAQRLRPDVVCKFYAFPISTSLFVTGTFFALLAISLVYKLGAYIVVVNALSSMLVLVVVIYVADMLLDMVRMPSPQATNAANRELAKKVVELTESTGSKDDG